MTSEYYNTFVMLKGRAYRVSFHQSGRCMMVCRKTKHGEAALKPDGPTARRVIRLAIALSQEGAK
jgi:hypothetical protein